MFARRLSGLSAFLPVAVLLSIPAMAQKPVKTEPFELRYKEGEVRTRVPPPTVISRPRGVATTINVTFVGFPGGAAGAEAAAFQFAVDIWESLLNSTVPIEVEARWEALDPGLLGSARPAHSWPAQPALPALQLGFTYPDALADSLEGIDICTIGGCAGEPDIIARFSSVFDWYLGTDGNVPFGKVDFVSVVLHELGHGLGFGGGMIYDDGMDTAECTGVSGVGCTFGMNPRIYDLWTESPLGTSILTYTDPSAALGSALISDALYWVGPNGVAANGGGAVRLYAPTVWNQGASYSHLNESTFPSGTINALMTPFLTGTESVHSPGPITLGMFEDMEWSVNTLAAIFTDGFESGNVSAWSSSSP